MRPSFFEFVKAHFIQDMLDLPNILRVENGEGVKVSTESKGDSFVEYSLEITFEEKQISHTMKLTAYATTSQIMIQSMNEKIGVKEHLGNEGSPRFFTEQFLLPWCKTVISTGRFDDTTRSVLNNILKEEIKKLDLNKLDQKKNTKSTNDNVSTVKNNRDNNDLSKKTDSKCVAKVYSYNGINPNNKAAVGVCYDCGNVEHFVCVGLPQEHKEAVTQGKMKYYCSPYFAKNPLIGTCNPPQRRRLDSFPIMAQGSVVKACESPASLRGLTFDSSEVIQDSHNCDNCSFTSTSAQELSEHITAEHKPKCSVCNTTFTSLQHLQKHLEAGHSLHCEHCNFPCTSQEILNEHLKEIHGVKCTICTQSFNNYGDMETHLKDEHNHQCNSCNAVMSTLKSLHDHINTLHRVSCVICSDVFTNNVELDQHMTKKHTHRCDKCDAVFSTKVELEHHLSTEHILSCEHCSASLTSRESLQVHIEQNHREKSVAIIEE